MLQDPGRDGLPHYAAAVGQLPTTETCEAADTIEERPKLHALATYPAWQHCHMCAGPSINIPAHTKFCIDPCIRLLPCYTGSSAVHQELGALRAACCAIHQLAARVCFCND
jgi:hypothetical protein